MQIETFFDERTYTLTYVVYDADTKDAVVIDSVLDFDPASGRVWTESIDKVLALVAEHDLTVHWQLETHAHADHLSASQVLKDKLGAPVAIGKDIDAVQTIFGGVFARDDSFARDGSQFDRLVADGDTLHAGSLRVDVIHTPGHTPACVTYKIEDAIFTGDALFMPDFGTGRCDFPGGSAESLYTSVHDTLYALPDETRVFVGHDYQPGGRDLAYETTIGASKAGNIQLTADTSREDYVAFRTGRDKGLSAPRLLLPSIQVNIDAGKLPAAADNGTSYLMIPLRPEL